MSEGRYYWLKLKRDFFKRHDIQILESMPNGKEYCLFYLKLLCESIDHEGQLRFSDTLPYDEQMLATITNTNIDIVRVAVKVLCRLDMMEKMDDGTLHMTEVQSMMGSASNTPNAIRMRRFNEKQKALKAESISIAFQNEMPTISNQNESKSKRKSKELEIEKDKRPSLEDVKAYCQGKGLSVDPVQFFNYFEEGNWIDAKGQKVKSWKQKLLTWEKYNTKPKKQLNNFSTESSNDYIELQDEAQNDFWRRYGNDKE